MSSFSVLRLAPMAGVTDWPFRTLCFQMGAQMCYTEMISAMGYLSVPAHHIATAQLLEVGPDEGLLAVQIFGHDPEVMAKAAARLQNTGKFIGIDINMGCPAHKIVGGGEGSALMREPVLAGRIMEKVVRAALLPVSVKLRLGWDDDSRNVLELARIAQESGVREITVHGRTRMQQYSGKADWDAIAQVKQAICIPVIANGDIFSASDALNILAHTGADGLMIGRGALGNPWLFSQIRALQNGLMQAPPMFLERCETALRHAEMMCAWKPESVAVAEMRKHLSWYIQGVHGAARMRVKINQAQTLNQVRQALDELQPG